MLGMATALISLFIPIARIEARLGFEREGFGLGRRSWLDLTALQYMLQSNK